LKINQQLLSADKIFNMFFTLPWLVIMSTYTNRLTALTFSFTTCV